MDASSGVSSGTSGVQNSSSDEDLQRLMEQRKRKRMISNRDSARRSRLRKQQQLDDLMATVTQLKKENNQIFSRINVTTHHYFSIEAENSILRAQLAELSYRLQSLNEIVTSVNGGFWTPPPPPPLPAEEAYFVTELADWSYFYVNQPIMASTDVLQY